MLSLVTVASVPEHRCFIAGVDNSTLSQLPWNSTAILDAIPLKPSGELDSCHMYNASAGDQSQIPCEKYVYDTTYYKTSRTIDWDFVCDRRWMGAIIQTVFMLGTFTGAVTLGGLADKVGRKTVFCWSALLQLFVGVGVAFIPEYFSVMVARFILGIVGSAGAYICGFVLTMELVGATKRTVCGITFQVSIKNLLSYCKTKILPYQSSIPNLKACFLNQLTALRKYMSRSFKFIDNKQTKKQLILSKNFSLN